MKFEQVGYRSSRTYVHVATRIARGRKPLQMHGFPIQTWGTLQSAMTLILRHESKFCPVKPLVLIHKKCPEVLPKGPQIIKIFFLLSA